MLTGLFFFVKNRANVRFLAFYIFTHPELREAVDAQFKNMSEGFDHADTSSALKS